MFKDFLQVIKFYFLLIFLMCNLHYSCKYLNTQTQFDCYSEAINILYSKNFVDTVYVANNFPNFRVEAGKFPQEIFYFNDLDENQYKYVEIKPDSSFWHFHLLDKVKPAINFINKKTVYYERFDYSFNIHLENNISKSRVFVVFSPIYYNEKANNGFFIASEINNVRIGSTKVFYIHKVEGCFNLVDHVFIHRFMPF